ncbi:hypothetical protein [Aquabacterium sp.]|uniref:hypothetical protein n=1 Tax=Aquabacterium sp. TaxID=1872578 RepID=UPI0035AF9E0A
MRLHSVPRWTALLALSLMIGQGYAQSTAEVPQRRNFDDMFAQEHPSGRFMDQGIEVMSPSPLVAVEAVVHGDVYRCKTGALKRFMRDQPALVDPIANTNFCVRLRSRKGQTVTAYVHDRAAPDLKQAEGSGVWLDLVGYYLYYSHERHQPILLITRIGR